MTERHPAPQIAVLFIDLDGFKPVNDTLGHAAGDRALQEAADRLLRIAGSGDTVARIGGDEFLLLMEAVSGLADVVEVAGRVLRALAVPIDVAGQRIEITGSVGIVGHPDQGQSDKLIAHADSAMYVANARRRKHRRRIRIEHGCERARPAQPAERPAACGRTGRDAALLSAQGRLPAWPDHRRRGAAALGSTRCAAWWDRASSSRSPSASAS